MAVDRSVAARAQRRAQSAARRGEARQLSAAHEGLVADAAETVIGAFHHHGVQQVGE
ncbi:MAG: hypothetical protein IPL61_35250 [Myxococcales bacterium]|nr:hypothetical protein [Myxococcales bacterium]